MTDLRTAAQQALEALDEAATFHRNLPDQHARRLAAMTALRAALAEPDSDSPERRCGGPGCDMRCCQPVAQRGAMFHTHPAVERQRSVEAAVRPACGVDPAAKAQPVQEPVQEPGCRDDGMPTSAEERHLRRLLALRAAMPHAYYDDGEAQGTEHGISIDFMREPVAHIDAKLRALNVARAIAKQAELVQDERTTIADLRCAKWLDPECAEKGACQSLKFKRSAEPAQEPVYLEVCCDAHPKWMRVNQRQFDEYVAHGWEGRRLYTSPPQRPAEPQGCAHCNHPLYAAIKCRVCGRVTEPTPPQRLPLTEEEIFKIENDIPDDVIGDRAWTICFARAIERAHKIGGEG